VRLTSDELSRRQQDRPGRRAEQLNRLCDRPRPHQLELPAVVAAAQLAFRRFYQTSNHALRPQAERSESYRPRAHRRPAIRTNNKHNDLYPITKNAHQTFILSCCGTRYGGLGELHL